MKKLTLSFWLALATASVLMIQATNNPSHSAQAKDVPFPTCPPLCPPGDGGR